MDDLCIEDGVLCSYYGDGASVVVPEGVTKIQYGAFAEKTNIIEITLPDSVTEIGGEAFYDCVNLRRAVMPKGLEVIEKSAFSGCVALGEITIPDSVRVIRNGAFYQCEALKRIFIPDRVTEIDEGAFSGCKSLTEIEVSGNNPRYRSVDGVLYDCDTNAILCYPMGKTDRRFTVPDGVRVISKMAFMDCPFITDITVPRGVTYIGNLAFSECVSLKEISLPEGVEFIGEYAFSGCEALRELVLRDGVKRVCKRAFSGCSSLCRLVLPDGIEELSRFSFITVPETARIHMSFDVFFSVMNNPNRGPWIGTVRGFLERYYSSPTDVGEKEKWAAYLKEYSSEAFEYLSDEVLLYRFFAECGLPFPKSAEELLGATENAECRAIVLEYINGSGMNTEKHFELE